MSKEYKKALTIFLLSVLAYIVGVAVLYKINLYLANDINVYKERYEERERIRNSPTELIYPEEEILTPAP